MGQLGRIFPPTHSTSGLLSNARFILLSQSAAGRTSSSVNAMILPLAFAIPALRPCEGPCLA